MNGETAEEGFRKLAFAKNTDAVRLLFCEDVTPQKLKRMDLFSVSEIRKSKNGEITIKFVDRVEALNRLSELERNEHGAQGFLKAIEDGAAALREKDAE